MISKPGTYSIEVEQDAALERIFKVKLASGDVDLTGYDAVAAIKLRPTDTEALLELSVGAGLTINGSGGSITMRITRQQTKALPAKKLTWSLRIVEPDGDPYPLLEGSFTVKPQRAGA